MDSILKNVRKKSGLKQSDVAKKAGITERSYQRIEQKEQEPKISTALLIAQALNSKPEKLFEDFIKTK